MVYIAQESDVRAPLGWEMSHRLKLNPEPKPLNSINWARTGFMGQRAKLQTCGMGPLRGQVVAPLLASTVLRDPKLK